MAVARADQEQAYTPGNRIIETSQPKKQNWYNWIAESVKYENLEDAVVTALFKLKPPKLHQALSDPGNPQSTVNSHKMIAGFTRPINSKKRIGLIERNCNE